MARLTQAEVDARFRVHDLEPLEPYQKGDVERRCRCLRCGTTRWVKLVNLARPGGIACRWCHGWDRWLPWSAEARAVAARWRPINHSVQESLAKVETLGLIPLTLAGDEFTPIGFLCPRCGETGVTVPERIGDGERGYFGCPRCSLARTWQALADAPAVFEANGLRLLEGCRGEYVPQPAECLTCGIRRKVSLADLRVGSAPLCWTCTHGIRPDEQHRIYLVHFPLLRAMKVGLTHARHDSRLVAHELVGGMVLAIATVPDRSTARRVERELIARYRPWATTGLGTAEFPQGGWTETWRDDAPALDLAAEVARLSGSATG